MFWLQSDRAHALGHATIKGYTPVARSLQAFTSHLLLLAILPVLRYLKASNERSCPLSSHGVDHTSGCMPETCAGNILMCKEMVVLGERLAHCPVANGDQVTHGTSEGEPEILCPTIHIDTPQQIPRVQRAMNLPLGSFQKRFYHPSVKSALYYPYLLST